MILEINLSLKSLKKYFKIIKLKSYLFKIIFKFIY
jgi:hypothetical protein